MNTEDLAYIENVLARIAIALENIAEILLIEKNRK